MKSILIFLKEPLKVHLEVNIDVFKSDDSYEQEINVLHFDGQYLNLNPP